ncbi:MAG: hypothetical protein JXB32_22275 [Deltaproteobacteria bacterium]|nr:hypothetical protein [Deltaproteobacteria bacterium]
MKTVRGGRGRLDLRRVPALLVLLAAGCPGTPAADAGADDGGDLPDAVEDEAATESLDDGGPGDDADGEVEGGPPPPLRALLIDYDVLHPDAWVPLRDALAAAEIALDYRRWYPHLTAADTTGATAYDLVVLASGLAPGAAAAAMSTAELDTATAFVEAGGLLVLAPWSGYLDSRSAENEWFLFNRVLESLGLPARIEKALLVGELFGYDPPPPHDDSELGYATTLESDIGYGWLRPNPELPTADGVGERLVAGRSTIVRTAGEGAEVWALASVEQKLWRRLAGATIGDQFRWLIRDHAVALALQAGAGRVAILPKGLLTVGGANGMVSQQPVLSPASFAANGTFLGNVARRLAELRRGAAPTPNDPSPDDERLFDTEAPGLPPLGDSTEVIPIAQMPSRHAVPPEPPAVALLAEWPVPVADAPAVPRFPLGPGTLGFGGVPSDPAALDAMFAEAGEMGLDTLMLTITPEQLVTGDLDPAAADALRARIADVADRAEAAGVPWTVGMYFSGHVFLAHDAEWPWSVGPQGQRLRQPAAAHVAYWDDALTPAVVEVATLAATHPGIAGIQIDLETYGGGLLYPDLQCFDDESFGVYLAGLADDALRTELAAASQPQRLDALIDRGLLQEYLAALEAHVAAATGRMRTAARALDPDFDFVLYAPAFSSAWFYRALGRGLGEAARPVVWLSYDTLTAGQRAGWVGDGISAVHLAGVIVGYFAPDDLRTALEAGLDFADGFWLYSFDELSATAAADPRHGTRADYRAAVAAAAAGR